MGYFSGNLLSLSKLINHRFLFDHFSLEVFAKPLNFVLFLDMIYI